MSPLHEPAEKAGASSAHSKRFRAMLKGSKLREAFGVRSACWRFRFMAPMGDSEIVAALHEPPKDLGRPKIGELESLVVPKLWEIIRFMGGEQVQMEQKAFHEPIY